MLYLVFSNSSQKEDDLMDSKLKQNELKLLVENLNSQINQKVSHLNFLLQISLKVLKIIHL